MNNYHVMNDIRQKLADTMDTFLILVLKSRHPFLTNLDQLEMSKITCSTKTYLILIMNSHFLDSTPKFVQNRFDFVLWFNGGDYWNKSDVQSRLDTLNFPDVEQLICRLVKIFSSNRLRLVSMEESFVRFAALLREKYNIPGPKSVDTEPFTSKVRMKILARTQQIPMPSFQIISPAGLLKSDECVDSLEEVIGYPMILKPAHGVCSVGVVKVRDGSQLKHWIRTNGFGYSAYLAEKCFLHAHEYILLALVRRNVVQFFPTILINKRTSVLEALSTGRPMAFLPSSVEKLDLNFKAMEFGRRVLDSLNPSLNSLVVIRLYLVDEDQCEFKFGKVSCRIPNPLCCKAFEQNSGISPETVHIVTQIMQPNLSDWTKPSRNFGIVAYPYKEGVLDHVPEIEYFKNNISSEIKLFQFIKIGDRMHKAKSTSDLISTIHLWNDNYNELLNDINYFCDYYVPVVS